MVWLLTIARSHYYRCWSAIRLSLLIGATSALAAISISRMATDAIFLTYEPITSLLGRRGKEEDEEEEKASDPTILFGGGSEWFLNDEGEPYSCKDLKNAVKDFEKAEKEEGTKEEEEAEEGNEEEDEQTENDSEGKLYSV